MQIGEVHLPLPPRLEAGAPEAFARDGFLVAREVVPAAELQALRELHAMLFASAEAGRRLAWPSRHAAWLAGALARRNAHALAAGLLGPGTELVGEWAVLEPEGSATPWHQDEAAWASGRRHLAALSCWIPLQTGCGAGGPMCVPGSHLGALLPHDHSNEAQVAALGPDTSAAVTVPVLAGDVLLRHPRMLHGAGPSAPRHALVLDFALRDRSPDAGRPRQGGASAGWARRRIGELVRLRW
jgi:hypothetical protein